MSQFVVIGGGIAGLTAANALAVHSAVARLAPPGEGVVHVMKYLQEASSEPKSLRRELEDYADLVIPAGE
jgi:protoporphyrinogen oxidase